MFSSSSILRAGTDYIGVGVGALIFNSEGKLLLTLRGQKAKNERGKWEIPGGSVEFGETFAQAIQREVNEELGISIEVKELLHLADHLIPDEKQHWVSPTYICQITSGVPIIKEPEKCEKIGWFSIDEAVQLPLSLVTQQDIEVLKKRAQHEKNKSV
jgi:8-oxo-dGTP diphosphatase